MSKASRCAALAASLVLAGSGSVTAQIFTVLYNFSAGTKMSGSSISNPDGAWPLAGLTLSGNSLYGTTANGGPNGNGTVFVINPDGTGFMNLHSFTAVAGDAGTNSDGAQPQGALIVSSNTLYGTASAGGGFGGGTVFAVNLDGTGFTNLHSFSNPNQPNPPPPGNSDGATPLAGLLLAGGTLYGTASAGGAAGSGTVFAVNQDGSGFTNLHSFAATSNWYPYINNDGAYPESILLLCSNMIYGTALEGGANGFGTVFAVNTNGTDFATLYSFNSYSKGIPESGLVLSGNALYGTAGSSPGGGTVYRMDSDGTGFTNLHVFNGYDGGILKAGLMLSGKTLYGTTELGGDGGYGLVFAVNTNGTGFTALHSFNGLQNGGNSYAAPTLLGQTLYGTTAYGGTNGNGTLYSLFFPPPQLAISRSKTNYTATWSGIVAGFYGGMTLQSTTDLVPPVAWTSVSQAPVTASGQSSLTDRLSGPRQFFRLSQSSP